jgi:hypothetical protein
VSARLLPYWYDAIVPDLLAGGCVLVVSHSNTLRALVKHLESIPDDGVTELDIPTGIPLFYELGFDLRLDALGGQYLDPHAASDAIEAIKRQGHQTQPGSRAGDQMSETACGEPGRIVVGVDGFESSAACAGPSIRKS